MTENELPLITWLILIPAIFGFFVMVFFIHRYQECRKKLQPLSKRLLSDVLGPFSLLIGGLEEKSCRKCLLWAYACAGVVIVYVLGMLISFAGAPPK